MAQDGAESHAIDIASSNTSQPYHTCALCMYTSDAIGTCTLSCHFLSLSSFSFSPASPPFQHSYTLLFFSPYLSPSPPPSSLSPSFPPSIPPSPTFFMITSLQPQVQPLRWPLPLKWRRGKDLPFGVQSAHTIVLKGQVYMGGGYAREDNNEYIVMRYDPSSGEWSQLPKSTVHYFAMASVKDQLLLAGGVGDSTAIQLWDSEDHRWNTQHYPRMPTGRAFSAAVGYQQYLIVACGVLHKDTVEVLDCSTHQWYSAEPVPVGGRLMTAVIISDYIYISSYGWSDGQSHVFSAHLPTLISNATHNTTTGPIWQELPSPPVGGPTLLALQNHLLLVGGRVGRKELYRYETEGKKWSKCGELPVGMWAPSCAVLPSGELLVAGGYPEGVLGFSQQVWVGLLE